MLPSLLICYINSHYYFHFADLFVQACANDRIHGFLASSHLYRGEFLGEVLAQEIFSRGYTI